MTDTNAVLIAHGEGTVVTLVARDMPWSARVVRELITAVAQSDAELARMREGVTVRSVAEQHISDERFRQITAEGCTEAHDDRHTCGDLALAAACYAAGKSIFRAEQHAGTGYEPYTVYCPLWPWADEWWKPKGRREDLVRAGALIIAEIERLDRAALNAETGGE